MKRSMCYLVPIMFLILLAGCDTFSLPGQFSRSGALPSDDLPGKDDPDPEPTLSMDIQKAVLERGETIDLYPRGGTEPYTVAVLADDLAYAGTLGSVTSDMKYTAGTSIGRITLRLRDKKQASFDTTITVIPPPPGSFTAQGNAAPHNAMDITLSWTYPDISMISGFRIERIEITPNSEPSWSSPKKIDVPDRSQTEYIDVNLNSNKTYRYRIYAVRSEYVSAPTQELTVTL